MLKAARRLRAQLWGQFFRHAVESRSAGYAQFCRAIKRFLLREISAYVVRACFFNGQFVAVSAIELRLALV